MNESRELLWDNIASDAAGGERTTDLARKYNYTAQGMSALLRSERMIARIDAYRLKIERSTQIARTKMALSLPDLIDSEIETALARDEVTNDRGELLLSRDGQPLTKYRYSSRDRMAARHYVLDKMLPTVNLQLVQNHTEVRHDVATELKDAILSLTTLAPQLPIDIRRSPHVLEGKAAIPSALEDHA